MEESFISEIIWEDSILMKYGNENFLYATCQKAMECAQGFNPMLPLDDSIRDALIKEMAAVKMNMVAIDLEDDIHYDSLSEITVKNKWTPEKIRSDLTNICKLCLVPIPKLNFSTDHDICSGQYSRLVFLLFCYKFGKGLSALRHYHHD